MHDAELRSPSPPLQFKAVRFSCAARTALLTDLFRALSFAALSGRCPLARTVLGSPREFECLKYRASAGTWQRCIIRVAAFSVERLDPQVCM